MLTFLLALLNKIKQEFHDFTPSLVVIINQSTTVLVLTCFHSGDVFFLDFGVCVGVFAFVQLIIKTVTHTVTKGL